jgi:serine/threonine-protein kinase
MSPEQAQGKTLTPASDIYSLAVILYEAVSGKLPFEAKNAMDFIQLHVTKPPTPLAERAPSRTFPPGLWPALSKAMEKNPEARFSTAVDFAEALRMCLPGAQPPRPIQQSIPTPNPLPAPRPPPREHDHSTPLPPAGAVGPRAQARTLPLSTMLGIAALFMMIGIVVTLVAMKTITK